MKKELKKLIEDLEPDISTLPEVKEKKLVYSSGGFHISLNPNWVKQWGLSNGDSVLVWVDEDLDVPCIFVVPFRRDVLDVLQKNTPADLYAKKRIRKKGRSLYARIPEEMVEVLGARARDTFGVYSDGLLGAMKYGAESKRKVHDTLHSIVMGMKT